jgi:hypothetical protein
MGTRDDRVDAYIARSADFAKPILTYLRSGSASRLEGLVQVVAGLIFGAQSAEST